MVVYMIRKTVTGYQKVFEVGGGPTDYDLQCMLKEDTILWTGDRGGYFSLMEALAAMDDEVTKFIADYKKVHVPEDEWPVPEVRKKDIRCTSVHIDYEFSQEVTSFEIVEVRVR